MRRIMSPEESESKEKRRNKIMGILLLLLLLGSTAGYAIIYYQPNQENQNTDTSNGWTAKFGDQNLNFRNSPESVKEVPVETSKSIQQYAGNRIYIDAQSDAILSEFQSTLGLYSTLQPACYGPCEKDLPEVNCTQDLIVWRSSDVNKVYEQEKCVFVEGDIRAVDAFIYRVFGMDK